MIIRFDAGKANAERLQAEVDSEVKSRSLSIHASQIGDPCLRRLALGRLRPEAQRSFDVRTKGVLALGKKLESYIIDILKQSGIEIFRPVNSSRWDFYNLSGTYDGMVQIDKEITCKTCNGKQVNPGESGLSCACCDGTGRTVSKVWAIAEIKTMKDQYFDGIHVVEDLLRYSWTKKYLIQLLTYCWLEEKDFGVLILFNKTTAQIKSLVINRDEYDHLSTEALNSAQIVEAFVKLNKGEDLDPDIMEKIRETREPEETETHELILPAKLNDQGECSREWCRFHAECLPVLKLGATPEILIKPNIFQLLKDREDCQEASKRFDGLNDNAKLWFVPDDTDFGRWIISPEAGSDKVFLVTAKRSKPNKKGVRSVRRTYTLIGADEAEGLLK